MPDKAEDPIRTASEGPDVGNQATPENPPMPTWLRIVVSLVGLVLFASAWFAVAGRVDWVQGWALVLFFVGYVGALVWRLSSVDPELMRERQRTAEDAEPWDRILIRCYLALTLALMALSALDGGRFRWSSVPLWAQLLGWGALCFAGAIVWHVMGVNAYLSSYARIQEDRGQVVVTRGLYGLVRHPMYLGVIAAFIGMPLALGSWWSLIPGLLIAALFVYRTAREDQMLRLKLDGYQEYAAQVRYRLLPGVW
jgi:protein-S-isoprenylcysteine O-methyltransferase Ste14